MLKYRYHEDGETPKGQAIFVFGSNEAGIHGAGAALEAVRRYGATYRYGEGVSGRSYALPTKDKNLRPLSLDEIWSKVNRFIEYAEMFPFQQYFVTRVGCGLAGYKDEDIAPMFKGAPPNCSFSKQWLPFLEGIRNV